MAESKGSWLDTKTNKVVSTQPEEGVQLVHPGTEPRPGEQAYIDGVMAAVEPAKKPAAKKSAAKESDTE